MAPAGQQAQHPLRIIGIHRLTQHQTIDYDDGVGGKDGPSIRLPGNRTSFIYCDTTGVGPRVFSRPQAFVDVCRTDLEGNPRR